MPSPRPQRIALLVDTSVTFSQLIIGGVAHYARQQPSWQILLQPRGVHEHTAVPRRWDVDGVITRVVHRTQAAALRRLRVPVINVSRSRVPGFRFPQVVSDEEQSGRLAAEHLLERGFRTLAYCRVENQPNYTDRMGPAFAAAVRKQGGTCLLRTDWRPKVSRRGSILAELERWLRSLPTPVGVLAWDAEQGHFLREACASAGLRIPEQVAIVSGEDDELLCRISYPPLSAVDCGSERIGYEAAALLARLLSGESAPGTSLSVAPLRVLARHSTDVLAMDDREVAGALEYLRKNAYGPLHVRDVLGQAPLSRRALEQRFRRALGRSPAAELRRLRVAKAQELLAGTNWSMPKIAAAAGFSRAEIMNRVFRRQLDETPTQYRRAARAGEKK